MLLVNASRLAVVRMSSFGNLLGGQIPPWCPRRAEQPAQIGIHQLPLEILGRRPCRSAVGCAMSSEHPRAERLVPRLSVRLDTSIEWRPAPVGFRRAGRTATMDGPMAGYAVAHLDEIEEFADVGCPYRPIRHHLGITAFGVTAWTARAAGDLVINEHDEDDPTADQELFLVLRGHAVFELDGDRVDAPPELSCSPLPARSERPPPRRKGRSSSRWKARRERLRGPWLGTVGSVRPPLSGGQYAEVADRLGALVAAAPQYPMLFFNLACCESQFGRT